MGILPAPLYPTQEAAGSRWEENDLSVHLSLSRLTSYFSLVLSRLYQSRVLSTMDTLNPIPVLISLFHPFPRTLSFSLPPLHSSQSPPHSPLPLLPGRPTIPLVLHRPLSPLPLLLLRRHRLLPHRRSQR